MKPKKIKLSVSENALLRDEPPSSSRVGVLLKKRRLERNLCLDSASSQLCIRRAFLEAIEEGDFKNLPERVYTLGFISSYARLLNLDEKAVLVEYHKEYQEEENPSFTSFQETLPKKGVPSYRHLVLGVVILIFGLGLWAFLKPKPTSPQSPPTPPQELFITQTSPLQEQPPSPLVQTSQTAESSNLPENTPAESLSLAEQPMPFGAVQEEVGTSPPAPVEIRLTAKERVWVQISNAAGIPFFTKTLLPEESYLLPQTEENAQLTMGNAAGLEIFVNGKQIPPLGSQGQVVRGFSLNPQKLQDLAP